jgi:hypothetical protein
MTEVVLTTAMAPARPTGGVTGTFLWNAISCAAAAGVKREGKSGKVGGGRGGKGVRSALVDGATGGLDEWMSSSDSPRPRLARATAVRRRAMATACALHRA